MGQPLYFFAAVSYNLFGDDPRKEVSIIPHNQEDLIKISTSTAEEATEAISWLIEHRIEEMQQHERFTPPRERILEQVEFLKKALEEIHKALGVGSDNA